MQRPLVQLWVSRSAPWHSSPPLRGAGSEHSRLRQWVQSSPQADHLLHGLQLPSTRCKTDTERGWRGQPGGPTQALGARPGLVPLVCTPYGVQLAWMTHANGGRHMILAYLALPTLGAVLALRQCGLWVPPWPSCSLRLSPAPAPHLLYLSWLYLRPWDSAPLLRLSWTWMECCLHHTEPYPSLALSLAVCGGRWDGAMGAGWWTRWSQGAEMVW